MKKFVRKKIAFLLACASILSCKTQARNKNEPQIQQTLAAVGGASDKNSNKGLINWVKNHKWQLVLGSALTVAAVTVFTILGVKYSGRKKNISNPNDNDNNGDSSINNKKICSEIEPKITKINKIEDNNNNELNNLNMKLKYANGENKNNNEILIENNKKEEPKKKEPEKEELEKIDADYIFKILKEEREKWLDENFSFEWVQKEIEKIKSDFDKSERMLKIFFDNLIKNKYQDNEGIDKDFVNYFNGISKIQKKNIKKFYNTPKSTFICLDFDEFSYLVGVDKIDNGKFVLRVLKFIGENKDIYWSAMPDHGNDMDAKNSFEILESDLLK